MASCSICGAAAIRHCPLCATAGYCSAAHEYEDFLAQHKDQCSLVAVTLGEYCCPASPLAAVGIAAQGAEETFTLIFPFHIVSCSAACAGSGAFSLDVQELRGKGEYLVAISGAVAAFAKRPSGHS